MALGDNKFKKGFGRNSRDVSGIRIPGVGAVPCKVMMIVDRPGKNDCLARIPEPFAGVTRPEFDRYLTHAGLTRDDLFITHLVRDYRDGESAEDWEIARDGGELDEEIRMVEPFYIVAAGRQTARTFLGDVDMDVVHGLPHDYVHPDLGPVIVIPINHPAAGFYNGENQPDIIDDFTRMGMVVRGLIWPRTDPGFEAIYEPNWINPFHIPESSAYSHRIALDTEGWLHNPWGLSVCWDANRGLVARKRDNMVSILAHNIEQSSERDPEFLVYLHNSLHDLQILEGLGVQIPEGKYRDTMVWSYLLCTEPQGLKPLAYRHCGMRMKSYEEVVAPYYRALFEEYVRTASEIPGLPDWEEEYVIIDNKSNTPKIKRPWGIRRHLNRILKDAEKCAISGEDFDYAERWNNIDDYKKSRVVQLLGEPPEPSLDFVPDDEAIPYSGCDAVATRRIGPILEARIKEMELERVSEIDHAIIPMIDRMQRVGMKANPEHFDTLAEHCTEEMSKIQAAIHTMTGALINPDSGDQAAELLFDQLKLDRNVQFTIKKTEAGDRYSTNDKILEALRFTHPVVPLVCDYREVSKIRSSFCWPIARYARQRPDRRIHPNLRITRVSSGRLSCTKPNLLAIPVRSDLGKRVRKGFVAGEGHRLGDWDLDQVEMRYMADESQDPELLRCFRNKIDVHRNTGSRVFGKKPEDVTGTERYASKRVGFGVITGITAIGLKAQMDLANATKNGLKLGQGGIAWTEDDCDQMIKTYFEVHRGVADYLDRCRAEARRYGYVRDRWGRIRYLPGIHSPIRHIRQEAERQSHSHKIQAGAQGIMKMGMAAVWSCIRQWWKEGRWVEPLLQVHDELLLEFEDDQEFASEVDFMVVNSLTQVVQLSVPLGAKGDTGYDWGSLKD